MRTPKPVTAINCADGKRRHFASINEMCRRLGVAESYATRRINEGKPCKGMLLFDDNHVTSPEATEAMRRHVKGYDTKIQRKQARKEGVVSVRIDRKTVILVPASKWTPDYAERYRAKMEESKPTQRYTSGECMRMYNDNLKKPRPKRGPGRPRKETK